MCFLKRYDCDLIFLDRLAKMVASKLIGSEVIGLRGDLGSGKTKFVQLLMESFSSVSFPITSPTFGILNTYTYNHLKIWHFDLYRINSKHELYEIGLENALNNGICIIEWPDILKDSIKFNLEIDILHNKKNYETRNIDVHCDKYWYNILSVV